MLVSLFLKRFTRLMFLLSQPDGELLPNSFIEHAATKHRISLRTGCVCNPGGAAALLGIEEDMSRLCAGVTLKDFEGLSGKSELVYLWRSEEITPYQPLSTSEGKYASVINYIGHPEWQP